jgi:chromatin structure-remodeling complex subunit SFH1
VNEVLIPIRVELDVEGFKIRDSFTWNMNGIFQFFLKNNVEQVLTPEKFAEYTCLDLELSPQTYGPQISNIIKTQVAEYKQYFLTSDVPSQPDSRIAIILEWDLSSNMEPEIFAKILASEMGLGGEFATLIAASIREQIFKSKQEGTILYCGLIKFRR